MTPQQARAKFGPPSHVVQGPLETAYNYDADHRRVVIVETRSHSSGDGTQLTDVELRAVVDAAFTRALEEPIRRLIAETPGIRVVVITSSDPGDPIVHLNVRDKVVETVSAWPPPAAVSP